MISVILYGRNDNYGYNLHKRATLSLNCIAETLTHNDDEIIFVDYNSIDDFPTFPEAIQDILTDNCKEKLRVIRVRSSIHEELFRDKTHLLTLEPIARNAGIRRMNPNNNWVLSTNTDMVFLPKVGLSLSELFSNQTNGNFSVPRYEIPESIWESFDRLKPISLLKELRSAAPKLHLKEIVRGDEWNLFDAPGDFQMFTKKDIYTLQGFDEEMFLGWHCDSNLNKRLWLLNGKTKSAVDYLEAYHCDHTRQVTPMHKSGSKANDMNKFVHDLVDIRANDDATWGLAQYELEELALKKNPSQFLISKLSKALSKYGQSETYSAYTTGSFEKNNFPEAHVIVFICDHLLPMGNELTIGWIGLDKGRKKTLSTMLTSLGVSVRFIDINYTSNSQKIDAIISSNFSSNNRNFHKNIELYLKLLKFTVNQFEICRDAKFIFTDVIQTRFEQFVRMNFNCSKTPYSARILSGKLIKPRFLNSYIPIRILHIFAINMKFYVFVKLEMLRLSLLEKRYARPVRFQYFRLLYKILVATRILKLIGWH